MMSLGAMSVSDERPDKCKSVGSWTASPVDRVACSREEAWPCFRGLFCFDTSLNFPSTQAPSIVTTGGLVAQRSFVGLSCRLVRPQTLAHLHRQFVGRSNRERESIVRAVCLTGRESRFILGNDANVRVRR